MKYFILLLVSILFLGCSTKQKENEEEDFPVLSGKYLGQEEPTLTPELFAPYIVSTGMSEINACFSPDYDEFFYTIIMNNNQFVIMTMKYENGQWQEPQVASFSGNYPDADPFITLDGRWLYFVSKRPTETNDTSKTDWDIWRLEKIEGEWANLERLDSNINSDANDLYPTLTNQGTLYFSSGKYGNNNQDVFYAKSNLDDFEIPVKLSDTINSHREGDIYISPEEDYMIFKSFGREEGNGLYISFKTNNSWGLPIIMDEEINMTGREFCPMVSPDGKYFFFTSSYNESKDRSTTTLSYQDIKEDFKSSYDHPTMGKYDVYWVDSKVIEEYRE